MLRVVLALLLILSVGTALTSASGCQRKNERELALEPGPQGTFVAIGTGTELKIRQEADGETPQFDFYIKTTPGKGISVGTAVGSAPSARKSDAQAFVPASITKVITTAVAMKHLGSEFRFTTKVSWIPAEGGAVAQDLTVTADGDPQSSRWESPHGVLKARLSEIARELKKRGVRRLSGFVNLVSADPRKDYAIPAFGMDEGDYLNCYGARVQSFNLQRNCASLKITASGQGVWLDSNIKIPVRSENAVTGSRLILKQELGQPLGEHKGFIVESWPGRETAKGVPVPDVKSWYGRSLLQEISREGIDVAGAGLVFDTELTQSAQPRESFAVQSAPISEIVHLMNKVSDNFLAEAMFKAYAGFGRQENIVSAGLDVLNSALKSWFERAGQPELAAEVQIYDGAGLSRANKVTPRAYLALLKEFTKEPWFPALWESLPIAGVDGTLKSRMHGNSARGVVRAKTGTLKGAYQLAGYIPRLDSKGEVREYIPFVLLTATTPSNSGSARAFQDKVLGELAQQINPHVRAPQPSRPVPPRR